MRFARQHINTQRRVRVSVSVMNALVVAHCGLLLHFVPSRNSGKHGIAVSFLTASQNNTIEKKGLIFVKGNIKCYILLVLTLPIRN